MPQSFFALNFLRCKSGILKFALLLVIVIVVSSSYSNTLHSPFLLDDFHSFIDNPEVYLKDISLSSLASLSQTFFGWYRWIPMVSFALNHKMGSDTLFVFHATNITIHVFSLLAVFFLALRLLRQEPPRVSCSESMICYCALFIAGLWAVHPIQTNAVTYVVQRMASIQTFFYVLSTALYVSGRQKHKSEEGGWRKGVPSYMGCILAAVGAFLSKENSAMLPFMLAVTELWFFSPDLPGSLWKRLKGGPRSLQLLFVLVLLLVFLWSVKIVQHFEAGYGSRHFNMQERLLTEARIVVFYLSLLIWPSPSRLSFEHDVDISTSLFTPPTTLASIIFLTLLLVLTFLFRKKYPLITYGSLWFFINLVIESTIVPLELIFEHRLYLPSIGFSILFVVGVLRVFSHFAGKIPQKDFSIVSGCAFVIILSFLSLLTFTRNAVWESALILHRDTVRKAPRSPRAYSNLAVALGQLGHYVEAIKEAEKCIELGRKGREEYAVAGNMIVKSYLMMGQIDKAIEQGEELLANRSKDYDAGALPYLCLNLADAYRQSGQMQKAFSSALLALGYIQRTDNNLMKKQQVAIIMGEVLKDSIGKNLDLNKDGHPDPGNLSSREWLARGFILQGERQIAEALLRQALIENPQDAGSRTLLETMSQEDRLNTEQKMRGDYFQKYVCRPFSRFKFYMAVAFVIRKYHLPSLFMDIGNNFLNNALRIRPDAADAYLLKGWYHYAKNEAGEAVAAASKAIEIEPDNAKVWMGKGFFLAQANKKEEAADALRKFLDLYPGYPERLRVLDIIDQLEGKSNLFLEPKQPE